MKQPYKVQNRTSESRRVKFVKKGGTVNFPKTPTASFVENSREAGFCLTAISPLPPRENATKTITLTTHPMGTDGRVSLFINDTLIESKRFVNKSRITDRQAWFNSEFGAYATYSGKEVAIFTTALVSPDTYRFVFEDDDIDFIFADTTNAPGDVNPTLIVEQYRLAFNIMNNKIEISCDGAKVESEEIVLDGDVWTVEIDGEVVEPSSTFAITSSSTVTYEAMVTLLEEHGIRVTELKGAVTQPIYCDGAVSTESCKMQDGGWMLEVDGVNMGGPYNLASLDEYSRRREVRIIVPPPLVCDIESSDVFYFSNFNPDALKNIMNAETRQVVMTNGDALSTFFNNGVVMWEYDPTYGRGGIRNLTEKCLLIYFNKWEDSGDADLNAQITFESDENATVLTIEGVYYISLAPVKYVAPILDYELMDDNGSIQNTSGGQAGNINIRFQLIEMGPTNPAGVTFTYAGVEHTVLPGNILDIPVPRILPNTSLSENVYVVRNEITILTPDVTLDGYGLFDYDLWQTTNYWDEYAGRNDVQMTVTANGVPTVFTGTSKQMDDPSDGGHPSASIGSVMQIQAEAKWVGCAVQISDTLVDGAIIDSNGYVEFTIPSITTGLWDIELINLDRVDERETPSQNPVTRLRTVNFI